MENLFLHYMNERKKRESDNTKHEPGPVITISREYGCYGGEIANLLAAKINKDIANENDHWVFISHQVLHDAANALDVSPQDITHIFGAEEKSFFDDMFSLFSSDRYLSDTQIKRILAQIVRSYSEQGKAIIVGRAGCVVAKHITKAIHIRIMAPQQWRVNQIKMRFNISTSEATSKVKETDKRRETFMEFYRGNKPDSEMFDLILNRSTLSTQEIVEQIYLLALQRNLV
jgi:cytidylate kinase